jgi:hypothetical protein
MNTTYICFHFSCDGGINYTLIENYNTSAKLESKVKFELPSPGAVTLINKMRNCGQKAGPVQGGS